MNLLGNWQLQLTLLATVAFAMLLGGCIGFEREISQRPAGMRTHMLIGGAAALLLGIGDLLADRRPVSPPNLVLDHHVRHRPHLAQLQRHPFDLVCR